MKKIKFASDLDSTDCIRLGGFDYHVLNAESSEEDRVRLVLQPIGFVEYIAFLECHEDTPWITI